MKILHEILVFNRIISKNTILSEKHWKPLLDEYKNHFTVIAIMMDIPQQSIQNPYN